MTVTTPAYCTREDVRAALDFTSGAVANARIDRAIQSGARKIEGRMHRYFYPFDETRFFNWPNYQYADPWVLNLQENDLIVLTLLQSPGNTGGSGGVPIPLNEVMLEPANKKPWQPYRRIELDRSTVAAWGTAPTPQHSIWAAGTWGYNAEQDAAGQLAADVLTGDTAVTVTDSALMGVGDILILNPGRGAAPFPAYLGTAGALRPYTGERALVQDRAMAATGLTQSGSGCGAAAANDDALATAGDGTLYPGEIVQLDTEQMLVESVTAGLATVDRAYNGTVLATHSAAAIYAPRLLTVARGIFGTAAAAYDSGVSVSRHRPPSQVRNLNLGLALDQGLQETSGYARTVGAGDSARPAGGGLGYLWRDALAECGRGIRMGTI